MDSKVVVDNKDVRSVYVMISDIIDSFHMKGKSSVYLTIQDIDLFDKATNYSFNVFFYDNKLSIDVKEN